MEKIFKKHFYLSACLIILFFFLLFKPECISAGESHYIILSHYYKNMDIGDKLYLMAYTSTGKSPVFKSSNSKIASVDKYGIVTAKKVGTAAITAKAKNCSAVCMITVNPTIIRLNSSAISIECNETYHLYASVSNQTAVKWKSSKSSIVSVDSSGCITGKKPGTATITAIADGYHSTCKVTVKKPVISLSKYQLTLYRTQREHLTVNISSGTIPKWRSNRSSVASVDENGYVTAHKNGTAIITVTADGSSKTCKVTVQKPDITVAHSTITIQSGERKKIPVWVSSGNTPSFKSSNSKIVSVSSTGCITGIKRGTAYITISEDGTKVRCTIKVI